MNYKEVYDRIVEWIDLRLGFTKTPLRPDPEYVLNPTYWLGLLMAATFVMQGLTGMFMLIYYVPSPEQAYSSTIYVINSVPLGHLIETFHLYDAYAMILLAFMHLTRNYFSSAQKKPREFMWVAGVVLGLLVLGFGLTGYLLPWTVISKSATDVAVGMVNFIPGQLGNIAKFLVVGSGSDADEIRRFFSLHTVILPVALAVFLAIKIYLFEVHGPSYVAVFVRGHKREKHWNILPWFPKILLYGIMLGGIYLALLMTVSALYPLSLPPEFTPQAAAGYVVQPDWYFLWLYQILKFSIFEGPNIPYALAVVVVLLIALILLPFYDLGPKKTMSARPVFITLGVIATAELITLSVWGYLTPGQQIPTYQVVAVLGGVASIIALASWITRKARRIIRSHASTGAAASTDSKSSSRLKSMLLQMIAPFRFLKVTSVFVLLLAVASAAFASLMNALSDPLPNLSFLASMSILLALSVFFMSRIMKKIVSAYESRC